MAEIKSSIELAMERTKHMAMSREDRERQAREEWAGRARGWLLELTEERADTAELERRLAALPVEENRGMKAALKTAAVQSLELTGDNGPALRLLEVLTGGNEGVVRVTALLAEYDRTLMGVKEAALTGARKALAALGVSGSAVRPNILGDEAFLRVIQRMTGEYQARLERTRRELAASLG